VSSLEGTFPKVKEGTNPKAILCVCVVPFSVLGRTVRIRTVRTTGSLGMIFEAIFGMETGAFSGILVVAAGSYCARRTALCWARFSRHRFGGGHTVVRTWAHFPTQKFWDCFFHLFHLFHLFPTFYST
jgi:hypothetical protein